MSRVQPTGNLRVKFCTSIANIAAPTAAEVNAGVELSTQMKREGFATGQEASLVDVSDVTTLFDKSDIGTRNASVKLTAFRDTILALDSTWSALPIGTRGVLVVGRFGFSGAGSPKLAAAGDRVETWPVAVSARSMNDTAANEAYAFDVTFATPDQPNDDAVVAA